MNAPAPLPAAIADDRSLAVPEGHVIVTGYVDPLDARPACRDSMSVGDVDRAYQRRLQLGTSQSWPCPNGQWDDKRFVIHDGRHEWIAAIMLGQTQMLVAWVQPVRNEGEL